MKVLLLGAGGQGGPCASILAKDKDVEEIVIGDINLDFAKKVQSKINSDKIITKMINAANVEEIVNAAKGMDVIIDLVTPKYYYNVMIAAYLAKVHYVNTAFDKFLWDDKMELNKKPKLHDEFSSIGKTALLGCGMSSGYTNVIARYYADKCDTVKSIKVRLAKKDTSTGKYGDAVTPWNPGWDPRQALLDFKLPSTVFRDGKYELKEEPFSEIEEWNFPEPIGLTAVSLHAHEEPYSIPLSFHNKGLQYCDFKYYVNMQIAPIVSLGLASEEEVNINGTKIKPIDVVLSKVPKAVDGFLNEDPSSFDYQDKTKIVSIMVEVSGTKNGKEVIYNLHFPNMAAPRKETYACYGTSMIAVALPAVTGAKLLVKGENEPGIIFPHDLDPKEFLDTMSDTGFVHRFEEI